MVLEFQVGPTQFQRLQILCLSFGPIKTSSPCICHHYACSSLQKHGPICYFLNSQLHLHNTLDKRQVLEQFWFQPLSSFFSATVYSCKWNAWTDFVFLLQPTLYLADLGCFSIWTHGAAVKCLLGSTLFHIHQPSMDWYSPYLFSSPLSQLYTPPFSWLRLGVRGVHDPKSPLRSLTTYDFGGNTSILLLSVSVMVLSINFHQICELHYFVSFQ